MHKSRLAAIVIDCEGEGLEEAARFWSGVFGDPATTDDDGDPLYRKLEPRNDDLQVLLQKVDHPSRVHIDIESDDLEAEAARHEKLGAVRLGRVKQWIVMQAPSGHRYCIVPPQRPGFDERARRWDD